MPVLCNARVYPDEDGSVAGVFVAARDTNERKRVEQQSRWLTPSSSLRTDAIIGKNLDGTIHSWNFGAVPLYGYPAEKVIGRPESTLLPPDRVHEFPAIP
jgi:PAS domain-containing protein